MYIVGFPRNLDMAKSMPIFSDVWIKIICPKNSFFSGWGESFAPKRKGEANTRRCRMHVPLSLQSVTMLLLRLRKYVLLVLLGNHRNYRQACLGMWMQVAAPDKPRCSGLFILMI